MVFNELLLIAQALEGFSCDAVHFWIKDAHYNTTCKYWDVTAMTDKSDKKSYMLELFENLSNEYKTDHRKIDVLSIVDNSIIDNKNYTFTVQLRFRKEDE